MRALSPFSGNRSGVVGNQLAVAGDTTKAFRQFRHALADQRPRMLLAVLFSLALTSLELLRPWPVKWVIDALTIETVTSDRRLVLFALLAFAIPVGIGALSEQLQIVVAKVSRKATVRIRSDVFAHLHRIELSEHATRHSGDLLMRVMGDVNMIRDLLFSSWLNILSRGTVLIGAGIIFIFVDWRLFLVALIPVPLLWLGISTTSRKVKKAAGKQRRKEGTIAATASEALGRIEVTKAFGAEKLSTNKFAKDARGAERATMAATKHAAALTRTTEILTGAGVGLVLALGALRVRSGLLTPGELLVAMSYTRMLYKPIRKLAGESARLAKATACANRVVDVLELPVEEPEEGTPAPALVGDIVLSNVHHRYPDQRRSLKGLSIRFPAGTYTAITGDNGSGKSTLLSLLLALYRPSMGQITVDGLPLDKMTLDSYRAQVAYVPQELSLFSGTIRENIAFGRPEATDEEIERAAATVLFDQVVDQLPDRYDTVLAENGLSLSGGQARRLMLARAAVRDAPIVLLDEPLAGLDPDARDAVVAAISNLAEKRTTLLVHHGSLKGLGVDYQLHLSNGQVGNPLAQERSA